MYKHILIATDGSKLAARAVKAGLEARPGAGCPRDRVLRRPERTHGPAATAHHSWHKGR